MRRDIIALLAAFAASATGCSSGSASSAGTPNHNGQTGSAAASGAPGTCADQCTAATRSILAGYAPETAPTFVSSTCAPERIAPYVATDNQPGLLHCQCTTSDGSGDSVYLISNDCAYYGRFQQCLIPVSEYTPCDPQVADSCQSTCAELQAALAEEAQQVYNVAIRSSGCVGSECQYVYSVNGQCFSQSGGPYDCSLSDQAIQAIPPTPAGGAAGASWGGGPSAGGPDVAGSAPYVAGSGGAGP